MKITFPNAYLVADGSLWNDHIIPQQLFDGGVKSIIMGVYQQWSGGKYILHPNCERILNQIVTDGRFILQAYYYYYPEKDPIAEANWFIDTIQAKKYPVTWAWADCEAFKAEMDPHARSEQNRRFCEQLKVRFPKMGVYTGKWYIDGYAPQMNTWLNKYLAWVPQYGRQPKEPVQMTWDVLKASWLPNYDVIIAPGQTGLMVGHQFTGDKCYLPGFYDAFSRVQALDVSLFTKEFIDTLGTTPAPVPTPNPTPIPTPNPGYTVYIVSYDRVNVRAKPDSNSTWVRFAVRDERLKVVEIHNSWALLTDGTYIFADFIRKA